MTTQEVAPRDGKAVVPHEAVGLSGAFGASDVDMAICSISQGMSQGKGEEGHFWFPDGTALKAMNTIVLDIVANRAIWAPVDSGIGAPICRSADRVTGLTLYPSFIEASGDPMKLREEDQAYVDCAGCRFYTTAENFEKLDGVWCPYGYALLMVRAEKNEPFLYFVKGMQVKSVKQRIVSPAIMRKNRTGNPAPYSNLYEWNIRLVEEKEKKRKYWIADITTGKALGEDERQGYHEMAMSLRGRAAEQMEESALEEGQQELGS